jgi:hypothetical protein
MWPSDMAPSVAGDGQEVPCNLASDSRLFGPLMRYPGRVVHEVNDEMLAVE